MRALLGNSLGDIVAVKRVIVDWLIRRVFLNPPDRRNAQLLASFTNFVVEIGVEDRRLALLSYPVAVWLSRGYLKPGDPAASLMKDIDRTIYERAVEGIYGCGGKILDLIMDSSPHYWLASAILVERDDLDSEVTVDLLDSIIREALNLSVIDMAASRFQGECASDAKKLIYYTVEGGYAGAVTVGLFERIMRLLESGAIAERMKSLEALKVMARLISRREVSGRVVLLMWDWLDKTVKKGVLDDQLVEDLLAILGALAYRSESKTVSLMVIEWIVEDILLNPNYSKVYYDEELFA